MAARRPESGFPSTIPGISGSIAARSYRAGSTDPKPSSYRQVPKVEPLDDQILAEGTELHICALLSKHLYFFQAQKAHLPMPVSGMSISFDPVIRPKDGAFYL